MILILSLGLIILFYISKPSLSYTEVLLKIDEVNLNGRIYSKKCIKNMLKQEIKFKKIGELDHPQ